MPIDWLTLCATVFALGVRHGLDADHLAAIDSLTRFNHGSRPTLARWCGGLFSIGHGSVVILVAATAGATVLASAMPPWVVKSGAWASVAVLMTLGLVNLAQVMRSTGTSALAPVGIPGRLLARLTRTANPISVAMVGALFALSFDTLSQALLFSAIAARFQGWRSALILGGLFTLGMFLLDGFNGAWMARLLNRADQSARTAAKLLGLTVSVLSLLVASVGAVRLLWPRVDDFAESGGSLLGFILIGAVVIAVIGVALPIRRRPLMTARPIDAGSQR